MRWLAIFSLLLVLMLLMGTTPAAAQTPTPSPTRTPLSNDDRLSIATVAPPASCGTAFVPCGALPFQIPRFPTFFAASPTAVPLLPTNTPIPVTFTPTPTNTPTATTPGDPTFTPSPSSTSEIDIDAVQTLVDSISDIQATLSFQSTNTVLVGSTPITMVGAAEQLGGAVGAPFSLLREFQERFSGLGLVSTVITFIFVIIMFSLLVQVGTIVFPILMSIVRLVIQIINVVLNAINIIWPF